MMNYDAPSVEMIASGLQKGIICIEEHDGIMCCAGEEGSGDYVAFYYEGHEGDMVTLDDYLKDYDTREIAEHIQEAMKGLYEMREDMRPELDTFTALLEEAMV